MNSRKFIIALAVTLYIVSLQVNISTLKTDIRILQDENSVLAIKVKALQEQQTELDSRVTYTVTVEQLEPFIRQIEQTKATLDEMLMKYKTTDELFKHLFGETWREP
jgi:regulator of replication initiation timing